MLIDAFRNWWRFVAFPRRGLIVRPHDPIRQLCCTATTDAMAQEEALRLASTQTGRRCSFITDSVHTVRERASHIQRISSLRSISIHRVRIGDYVRKPNTWEEDNETA